MTKTEGVAVYIATGLQNQARMREVRDILRYDGHTITFDWTEAEQKNFTTAQRKQTAMRERAGVRDADVVLVILPGGRGTHSAMGMALAWGKPILLLYPPESDDASSVACIFYSLVETTTSIDYVRGFLKAFARRRSDGEDVSESDE